MPTTGTETIVRSDQDQEMPLGTVCSFERYNVLGWIIYPLISPAPINP